MTTSLAEENFITDYEPINDDGTVNAVIEIPAGTNEKWEVQKKTGKLELKTKNGKPRIVKYLGYPGNYGMIPGTLLPKENGGDGDPLDILVIGESVKRGSVLKARLIGALKFLDKGEMDDKLLAISDSSPLAQISDMDKLKKEYTGILLIIKTWFENYKGPGKMKFMGYADHKESWKILKQSIQNFKKDGKLQ